MARSSVTLRDIAEKAGISPSAVSLALRNDPKIGLNTRQKVQRLARSMGYVKDPRVSELMIHLRQKRPQRKSSHIAVLIPEITSQELGCYHPIREMMRGVREECVASGFGVETFPLVTLGATPKRLRSILLARDIRALLIAPYRSGVGTIDFDFGGFCAVTCGYSIIDPNLNRACPNYLQMMDELLENLLSLGYRRIGLAMSYSEGGIGHKLLLSSFLYYQSLIPPQDRIPVLSRTEIEQGATPNWIRRHSPEAVISSGGVLSKIRSQGWKSPTEIGLASIDLAEAPSDVSGMDHRYHLVGKESTQLLLSSLYFNQTGLPEDPKVILVDSHFKAGTSLRQMGEPIPISLRAHRSNRTA